MYVCMYVCMHMYVCRYVCMYTDRKCLVESSPNTWTISSSFSILIGFLLYKVKEVTVDWQCCIYIYNSDENTVRDLVKYPDLTYTLTVKLNNNGLMDALINGLMDGLTDGLMD